MNIEKTSNHLRTSFRELTRPTLPFPIPPTVPDGICVWYLPLLRERVEHGDTLDEFPPCIDGSEARAPQHCRHHVRVRSTSAGAGVGTRCSPDVGSVRWKRWKGLRASESRDEGQTSGVLARVGGGVLHGRAGMRAGESDLHVEKCRLREQHEQ